MGASIVVRLASTFTRREMTRPVPPMVVSNVVYTWALYFTVAIITTAGFGDVLVAINGTSITTSKFTTMLLTPILHSTFTPPATTGAIPSPPAC